MRRSAGVDVPSTALATGKRERPGQDVRASRAAAVPRRLVVGGRRLAVAGAGGCGALLFPHLERRVQHRADHGKEHTQLLQRLEVLLEDDGAGGERGAHLDVSKHLVGERRGASQQPLHAEREQAADERRAHQQGRVPRGPPASQQAPGPQPRGLEHQRQQGEHGEGEAQLALQQLAGALPQPLLLLRREGLISRLVPAVLYSNERFGSAMKAQSATATFQCSRWDRDSGPAIPPPSAGSRGPLQTQPKAEVSRRAISDVARWMAVSVRLGRCARS